MAEREWGTDNREDEVKILNSQLNVLTIIIRYNIIKVLYKYVVKEWYCCQQFEQTFIRNGLRLSDTGHRDQN